MVSITNTQGKAAWWLLTLKKTYMIYEIRVYARQIKDDVQKRINGVTVWIGSGLKGGDYSTATKVGIISYIKGRQMYSFSSINREVSNVEVQGGSSYLELAEVEVYHLLIGKHETAYSVAIR